MSDRTRPSEQFGYVVVARSDLRDLLDHLDDRWDDVSNVQTVQRLEAALDQNPEGLCVNCGGVLVAEPLAPEGVVHLDGRVLSLLCPGHSTVSSDGSNTARQSTANDPSLQEPA